MANSCAEHFSMWLKVPNSLWMDIEDAYNKKRGSPIKQSEIMRSQLREEILNYLAGKYANDKTAY